jgi:glycosyltransferase involved in cell wall biosynthesis
MRIVLDLQGAQSDSRFRGIGRYSLALAEAIAREAGQHEVWLTLSGRFPESIEPLRAAFTDLIPLERIRIFELPGPVAELNLNNAWRMQAAELLREKFLTDLRPDIVHVSTLFEGLHNEVVASVGRLNTTVPTAVTFYDLIPLLRPETYLPDPVKKRCYLRRAQSLKRADLILAISQSSRREAVETLHFSPSRIVNIAAGVQPWFQAVEISSQTKIELIARFGLDRPFVLFTGGAEPRKNLERLIAAFGLLPAGLRAAHQLAVAGNLNDEERDRIIALAREHHLAGADIVLLGYTSDDDLRLLYAACALFVFPSLHEGFGLPVLEAMACGAPVIGSDCTSIPEIINRGDALFNPLDPQDIAVRMAQVLSNPELCQSLNRWGRDRAKMFTWETSARAALRAFEALHGERKSAQTGSVNPRTRGRPLLAFVAPLPPERTGIAGYCARLLPNLARHYEIICIVDQLEVSDPWLTAEFVIRNVRWFEANANKFERILYQFGNSPSHKHMFDLLERHLGVVVLHDFYLSAVLNWMADSGYAPGSFTKALYNSHGFSALAKNAWGRPEESTATFPCNASVLRDTIGVIVHSRHAAALARTWYGEGAPTRIIRQIPFLPHPPEATDRIAARKRLGLPENAFVACSFGFLAPTKLSDRLLEVWLASPTAQDDACFLVFAGENHGGEYGEQLMNRIAVSGVASRIRITGYIEESQYRDYLAAADLGVQLRIGSRGETSGAIFDCLSRSVPLLINAHGSAAELPDDALMKLDDDFTNETLSAALVRLRTDADLRQKLAARGALYVNEVHHPERVAERYRDAIEEFYITNPQAQERNLEQAIVRISTPAGPAKADLAAVAVALAANRERLRRLQILIDVTNVAKSDLRTGIERVTRGILMALIADPPPGYRIEPVRAVGDGYRYARRFACQCLGLPDNGLTDDPIETGRGDFFIGMDWCADVVPSLVPWFEMQKRRGMRVIFAIYDILPLMQPRMFPPEIEPMVRRWLDVLSMIADGLVCISRTVADEVLMCLNGTRRELSFPLQIGFFHLGADLHASLPTRGILQDHSAVFGKFRSRPTFLMVGTVEPRKGHRQALAAMERLWADGVDANLAIVGKKGWMIDDLAERLQEHPERGDRLFWLQGISDEMLEQIYRSAHALLVASKGEGFGLPLIEAAQYGLPIIARDIPVFREVAGEHAYYFRGEDAQALADALRAWLSLGNATPVSIGIRRLTWRESSRQLLDVVLGDRFYRSWPDPVTSPRSANIRVNSGPDTSAGAREPISLESPRPPLRGENVNKAHTSSRLSG